MGSSLDNIRNNRTLSDIIRLFRILSSRVVVSGSFTGSEKNRSAFAIANEHRDDNGTGNAG